MGKQCVVDKLQASNVQGPGNKPAPSLPHVFSHPLFRPFFREWWDSQPDPSSSLCAGPWVSL